MTEGPYRIVDDLTAGLLRVSVRGFWSAAIIDAYAAALRSAIEDVRRRDARLMVLIDASTMQAQAADTGSRFVDVWRSLLERPEDRGAIAVRSALAAMQFRRIYESDRCRVFDTAAAAEHWLAGERRRAP